MNLDRLTTERRNINTMNLDELSTFDILSIMNNEDRHVPEAIHKALPEIDAVVKQIIKAFNRNGRLIYIGAGTSGRLGILDAAECIPTFGTDAEMVQGLIAGGEKAMTIAVEGAEDSELLARNDLVNIHLTEKDIVIGIAASGRTPYVIGGLKYANQRGATTATISCNKDAEISDYSKYPIEVDAGPEVLTGSTRLKAGTTQKLILNMLSTVSMIGVGKVYKNLMVDVKPTNEKLVERAKRIIIEATDCDYETAEQTLLAADNQVKVAIVMILTDVSKEHALDKLQQGKGFVKNTLNN